MEKMEQLEINGIKYVPFQPETADSKVAKQSIVSDRYIGQYVIVRTRNEGVNAGTVLAADETGIVLGKARRLHYHKPLDGGLSWYEGVAISGLGSGCRVSAEVTEKAIIEDYSITLCSPKAQESIINYPTHEQN